ncbi:MAG: protein kinase, partial [Tepidisphaeraceae bacterium]
MSELKSSQAAENPEARPTLAGTVPIFQPLPAPAEEAAAAAPTQARWEPGAVLNGRFRIVALVGAGGMGEVYLADDLTLALPVALKFLSSRFTSDPKLLAGLYNEVRLGRQVSHPNVCRIYDIAEVAGTEGAAHPAFICMEYIVGETLDSILHRVGRLPREKAMRAAQELCAGLSAVHDQGLLHRDLKPSNVMIDDRGTARLADFGVAALAQEAAKTGLVGTPGYLPPEVLDGKPATVQSDIYALGLVLYEIFNGKGLFKAMTPAAQKEEIVATDVPALVGSLTEIDPAVKRVIIQCLRREPEQRPASVRAVAAALAEGAERVRRGRTLVLGTLLTLAVILADMVGLTSGLERAMYDFRARHFQFFAPPPTDKLVHVDIDDAALEEIGRWPWPRSQMAQIVSELDRAQAKVIGLDVVYSEPENERTVRQADGSLKTVDDDAVFARTLASGNNALIPVHLPVDMAPPPSPVREKIVELLETNLEQSPDQLRAGLKDAGLSASDEQFNHEYPFALREAIFARVDGALKLNPGQETISKETLRRLLLPQSFATGIKTPADDALERALPQVLALRDLQRFSLPA